MLIMSFCVETPRQLYKFLLRSIKKLPRDAQVYYKHHVKQEVILKKDNKSLADDTVHHQQTVAANFNSHADETNSERIQEIILRAVEDCEWVMKKYAK